MSEYVDLAVNMVTGEWGFMMWIVAVIWGYLVYVIIYNIILGKGGKSRTPEFQDTIVKYNTKRKFDNTITGTLNFPSKMYYNFEKEID